MSERLYEFDEIDNLKDMLEKSGKLYGNNTAYKIKNKENEYREITHKEVREMINGLGTSLINMGLKGKRIAVIGENRYEWEIAYLAITCGVGTVVPLDKSLPENELRSLIERSEVEAIFYSAKYENLLIKMKFEGVGKLKNLISMDRIIHSDGIYSELELIQYGKNLIQDGNKEFINAEINDGEMLIMLFTSGTTSKAKIVALSHKNLCSNLMDLASILDINEKDVFLSFLPLHHVFECTVGFLFPLYKGAQIVFCDGMRHIIENMKEYKVSVMASVPAIYERIFKIISKQIANSGKLKEILELEEIYKDAPMEKKKEVFSEIHEMLGNNVKLLISGAAALDHTIEEKYRKLGINLVQGYGLTETSPVIAMGNNKYHKIGSIGKAIPSIKVKIVDMDESGIGELVCKGPNIMLGYYDNPEATKEALVKGWFYTGDLAQIDEEGYIFIHGRKKSVIVLKNGKNIFPEEMENLLNRIEGIKESFVYGKPMSNDKNDIKIFAKLVYDEEIIKKAYKIENIEELEKVINQKVKAINAMMPKYKSIKGITLTKEPLIKTTTNKIKRKENLDIILKEDFWKIITYEEIDSTQKEIWRRAEYNGIKNGTVIIANMQTNGIGTHGRAWYADKDNIIFSIYLNPNLNIDKLENLTLEIAEILLQVFEEEYNIKLNIKKPNDLVFNGKKLGGILTETKLKGEAVKDLVIGIGINTNQQSFNKEIETIASSIKNEFNITVNNEKVINSFLLKFREKFMKRMES